MVKLSGKDVTPIVHNNLEGKLIGGGRHDWLIALLGYALKFNLVIDDIQK